MTTLTATFSDGDVKTRTTERAYTYAWRYIGKGPAGDTVTQYGFAGSAGMASTAGNAYRVKLARRGYQGAYEFVEVVAS